MKKKFKANILEHVELATGMHKMVLQSKEVSEETRAGQFINVYCNTPGSLLPRPISICEIDKDKMTVTIVYAEVGKGTKALSEMSIGEEIEMVGPQGNGFVIPEHTQNHLVIGGGIGAPPLLELVKQLKGNIEVYLGFRSNPILVEEFEAYGARVHVVTDDGSTGIKGTVLDILRVEDPKVDIIYSCGPKPMLKAIAHWAEEKQIKTQVSMEERMACGIGACVGCTCKTKKKDEGDWQNRRVCKDGPVFWSDEVIWHD